ncbi:UTP--glucose-1-phosphate uridylyltransferase GalU [Aquibacillus rhizosphaerae]|uniref:UTP--glucose-1-phosphate uridylyltransferase n=1 Tax=Aquibacillus rhizosphaerae TaxID=3051431 RepID=A0ABT7KZI0_9BACI|nr:UTP--glucose-1-phosphate uridylyltransferase GalU [Aquibacillus sp. LR5S19]MDL4838883.1 UTP--glucose-1-phosphate uridylyltransferase GalU [Aquibacillus sp. LR5S19]
MNIKKAIIPAAGLGTRFLPATKAQPKEMLPIVDKPTIQYIVEEAVASGIEDIIIVSGRGKRAIEDHFDISYELEETLAKKEKFEILKEIRAISGLANIHYIRQKEPKGLGHAIGVASRFIGNEPFAVLLGDDIVQSEEPCLQQLINVFNKHQSSVIGVQEVPVDLVANYGIVDPLLGGGFENGTTKVRSLVEKPPVDQAPSNLAIMGRYILTPEIFNILETLPPGKGGEIQLTDAIEKLNETQQVLCYSFKGKRFDIGNKLGFIKATIEFGLDRNDLKDELMRYMEDIVKDRLTE